MLSFPLPVPRQGVYRDGAPIVGGPVAQPATVLSAGGAGATAVGGRTAQNQRSLAVTLTQTDVFGVVLVDSVNFDYVLPAPFLDRAYRVSLRVLVRDAAGDWVDLSSLAGRDWVEEAEWDEDLDQPVAQATVTLSRQSWQGSLAPMVAGSPFNHPGLDLAVDYAPLLEPGRELKILAATTYAGQEPAEDDWKGMFWGVVDEVDWGPSNRVKLSARDLGGRLVDAYIEEDKKTFWQAEHPDDPHADARPPLEVLQLMLDAVLPQTEGRVVAALEDGPDGPIAPEWVVVPFQQDRKSLMDALRDVALQFGWDVRYRWNEARTEYRLTLFLPERDKTEPDHDLGPSHYLDVTRLATSSADVRNVVKVVYVDGLGTQPPPVVRTNDLSVERFGRRYMEVVEASTSMINTQQEAENLADVILSDLSDPGADQEVELLFYWPARLGDLFRFAPNGVHYGDAQTLAALRVRHSFAREKQRTTLAVRGRPAGAYRDWLRREVRIARGSEVPPVRPVVEVRVVTADTESITYQVTASASDGSTVRLYRASGSEPFPDAPNLTSGESFPVPRASTAAEDRLVRIRAVTSRGAEEQQVISVDYDTLPEVVFVNPPEAVFEGSTQVGWLVTGAVDDDTRSLKVTLDGAATITSLGPLPTGADGAFTLSTVAEKVFTVNVSQAVGARASLTFAPRAADEVEGHPFVQPISRAPVTVATTRQPTLTRREVTFSVTPPDATVYFRLNDGEVQVSTGPSVTLPVIDVSTQAVTIRFHSMSVDGVVEPEQSLRLDADAAPEIGGLELRESPANFLTLSAWFDDDVATWRVWARRGASPLDPRTQEPDDAYQKFMGTGSVKSTGWYAGGSGDAGSEWFVVVRAYDRTGQHQQATKQVTVQGATVVEGALSNVRGVLNPSEALGYAYNDVLWEHNEAVADGYTLNVYENDGPEPLATGRDPRVDHDGQPGDPGAGGTGGWHRRVAIAAPGDEDAHYLTFRYRVELMQGEVQKAVYFATVSGWYLGSGNVETMPTQVPGAPLLLSGRASATAIWTAAPQGESIVVEWETAAVDMDDAYVPALRYRFDGSITRQMLQFPAYTWVRCRVAYRTTAGTGTFSDYSPAVRVLSSSGGLQHPAEEVME